MLVREERERERERERDADRRQIVDVLGLTMRRHGRKPRFIKKFSKLLVADDGEDEEEG